MMHFPIKGLLNTIKTNIVWQLLQNKDQESRLPFESFVLAIIAYIDTKYENIWTLIELVENI